MIRLIKALFSGLLQIGLPAEKSQHPGRWGNKATARIVLGPLPSP